MTVVHIVLVKIKDEIKNDSSAFEAMKAQCEEFAKSDIVKKTTSKCYFGPPTNPERSAGFDWGLYSVFESQEKLKEYIVDSVHQDFSANKLRPQTKDFLAYDFEY